MCSVAASANSSGETARRETFTRCLFTRLLSLASVIQRVSLLAGYNNGFENVHNVLVLLVSFSC